MITSKRIGAVTAVLLAIAILVSGALLWFSRGDSLQTSGMIMEYETKLFGSDIITIAIEADEEAWQTMLDNATAEEYITCNVTVNGTKFENVGIRPKGNSSLTTVASSDSDRYSFRLKFDKYVKGQTCFGLNEFVVNNIQSDATYMKEYLSYELMDYIGVTAPLYSYADISLNGETWGFYLAVECYDESFLARSYGTTAGSLYNVKSMDMGGNKAEGEENNQAAPTRPNTGAPDEAPPALPEGQTGDSPPTAPEQQDAAADSQVVSPETQTEDSTAQQTQPETQGGRGGGMGGGSSGGSLAYTDDSSDSYSAIFGNAVFNSTDEEDYQRVIAALKNLSTLTDLEESFDVDQIIRYFAAHTVVVNLDSYLSNMQQNYYLYENDGKVTILPWDYNLAFGGFQSGSASSVVNFPIDTPVSGVSVADRPLLAMILENDSYKERYHAYLQEIVSGYYDSGLFESNVAKLQAKISEYVKNDTTALFTYEQYEAAVPALVTLCKLRAESIAGQLDGSIPSTTEEQSESADALIAVGDLSLSTLGSQGGGGGNGGNRPTADDSTSNETMGGAPDTMPDMSIMRQARELLGDATTAEELTETQKEELSALGITEEQLTQLFTFTGGKGGFGGKRPDETANSTQPVQGQVAPSASAAFTLDMGTAIMLAVCVGCLLIALLFAKKFRRKG